MYSCYTGKGLKFGIVWILHLKLKISFLVLLPVFTGIRKATNIFVTNISKRDEVGTVCSTPAIRLLELQYIVRVCIWGKRKHDIFWRRWENNIKLDLKGVGSRNHIGSVGSGQCLVNAILNFGYNKNHGIYYRVERLINL